MINRAPNSIDDTNPLAAADRPPLFSMCSQMAVLVGMGACLVLRGLAWRSELFAVAASRWGDIAAGGLIALAIAPLIPPRVAASLGVWRPRLRGVPGGDTPLLWTTLGGFALLAGLAAALLPTWVTNVGACHQALADRFLWPATAMSGMALAVVVVCVIPVALPLGMALSCIHHLAGRGHGWNIAPLGWALLGAGIGSALADTLVAEGLPGHALLLIGAVPILSVSALAAHRAGRWKGDGQIAMPTASPALPDLSDHSPMLIRLAVAWLAVATAVIVVVWARVAGRWSGEPVIEAPSFGVFLAGAAGVGLIVCERCKSRRSPSLGGLGLAGTLCGAGVAAAAALPAALPGVWLSTGPSDQAAAAVSLACGAAAALAGGFALGYGQLVVLCRVGSRAATGAVLLSVCMAAGALAMLTIPDQESAAKTAFAQLAAVALSLAALGGTAIIHEPNYAPRTRRWRLAVVGACVAVMIYGLPVAGQRWARLPASLRAVAERTVQPGPDSVTLTAALP